MALSTVVGEDFLEAPQGVVADKLREETNHFRVATN